MSVNTRPKRKSPSFRVDWAVVLETAKGLVSEFEAEYAEPPDLRTLHYDLVELIPDYPNVVGAYKGLSRETAEARRNDGFPDLSDASREIDRPLEFGSPAEALSWLQSAYVVPRTTSQPVLLYVVTEKRGLVVPMRSWFEREGIPIIPLGGYASQTLTDRVRREVARDGRPTVLLICSDFDPSGLFLPRDFIKRAGPFDHVERVGLDLEQLRALGLPENPAPAKDPRLVAFERETGTRIQVELNTVIRNGYLQKWLGEAVAHWWDEDAFARDLEREDEEQGDLAAWIERGRLP